MASEPTDGNSSPLTSTRLQHPGPARQLGLMSPGQLIAISAYWFATNFHWGALLTILMPSQVAHIDPVHQAQSLSRIWAIGALVAAVMPPLIGAFSDRCHSPWGRRRPFMIVGVAVNILGLLFMWHAWQLANLQFYFLAYLVIQFGNTTATGSYSGIIPDLVREEQQGQASGYMAAMTQLGTVLGALFVGYLLSSGHAAASFGLIAVVLLLFLGLSAAGIRERPLDSPQSPINWLSFFRGFWIDPRRFPDFAWVWITRALVMLGMYSIVPFILFYLRDMIHAPHPERLAGLLMTSILLGSAVTGIMGGIISDRVGRKRVVYVSNVILAIGSISFLFIHSLPALFTFGTLYGFGLGAYYSVDWALGCAVLPDKEDAARGMGVWHIAMVLPQSIAPSIAAALLDHFGHTSNGGYSRDGYSAIFVLAAFFLLLGAFLLRNVKSVR